MFASWHIACTKRRARTALTRARGSVPASVSSRVRSHTARRAEALVTVTRTGRDPLAGLGWPTANRARPQGNAQEPPHVESHSAAANLARAPASSDRVASETRLTQVTAAVAGPDLIVIDVRHGRYADRAGRHRHRLAPVRVPQRPEPRGQDAHGNASAHLHRRNAGSARGLGRRHRRTAARSRSARREASPTATALSRCRRRERVARLGRGWVGVIGQGVHIRLGS